MGELIKKKTDNELDITEQATVEESEYKKVFHTNSSDDNFNYQGVFNTILQYFDLSEIAYKIEKGSHYVVQIPTQFKEGFAKGEYFIMENSSSGKSFPNLMKVAENGQNRIVSPLPIKKESYYQGNSLHDMLDGYDKIAMQNQMSEALELLKEAIEGINDLKAEQKANRIGEMNSGKEQIQIALIHRQKNISGWEFELANGRQNVSVAKEQFLEILKEKVYKFKPVSPKMINRMANYVKNSDYGEKKDNEYNEIWSYYDLYVKATKYLALSYSIIGDAETADRIFNKSIDEIGMIDFSSVKTIEYLHKKSNYKSFSSHATDILKNEELNYIESSKKYDCLEVELKGEELLEVLENEREF